MPKESGPLIGSISEIMQSEDFDFKKNKKMKTQPIIDKNRKRKTKDQIRILKSEFNLNPNWTDEKIDEIGNMTNLNKYQVYKWNWDKRKKLPDQH